MASLQKEVLVQIFEAKRKKKIIFLVTKLRVISLTQGLTR